VRAAGGHDRELHLAQQDLRAGLGQHVPRARASLDVAAVERLRVGRRFDGLAVVDEGGDRHLRGNRGGVAGVIGVVVRDQQEVEALELRLLDGRQHAIQVAIPVARSRCRSASTVRSA
jgi:hypothetical protein